MSDPKDKPKRGTKDSVPTESSNQPRFTTQASVDIQDQYASIPNLPAIVVPEDAEGGDEQPPVNEQDFLDQPPVGSDEYPRFRTTGAMVAFEDDDDEAPPRRHTYTFPERPVPADSVATRVDISSDSRSRLPYYRALPSDDQDPSMLPTESGHDPALDLDKVRPLDPDSIPTDSGPSFGDQPSAADNISAEDSTESEGIARADILAELGLLGVDPALLSGDLGARSHGPPPPTSDFLPTGPPEEDSEYNPLASLGLLGLDPSIATGSSTRVATYKSPHEGSAAIPGTGDFVGFSPSTSTGAGRTVTVDFKIATPKTGERTVRLQSGDDPSIPYARTYFKHWEKCARVYKVYGPKHKHRARALDEACSSLDDFLHNSPELRVQVTPRSFFLYGVEVYRSDDEKDTPFVLHGSGVRELVFKDRAIARELDALLDAIGTDFTGRTFFEDDVVTLFWRSRPRSIQLRTTITFLESTGDDDSLLDRFNGLLDQFRMARLPEDAAPPAGELSVSTVKRADIDALIASRLTDGEPAAVDWLLSTDPAGDIEVDAIELRKIGHVAEDNAEMLRRFAEIEFRALTGLAPGDPEGDRLVQALSTQLRALLESGRPASVIALLQLMTTVANDPSLHKARDPLVAGQELLTHLWSDDTVRVAMQLAGRDGVDLRSLVTLVRQFSADKLEPALRALPERVDSVIRATLLAALTPHMERRIDDLPGILLQLSPTVLPDVIDFIGATERLALIGALELLADYPEPSVQQHVIDLASTLVVEHPELARRLAVPALNGHDPRLRVRALEALLTAPDRALSRHLQEVMERDSFKERTAAERRRFYDGVGRCGGPQAVRFLGTQLARRGGFFGAKEHEQQRIWAASALALTGDPGARRPLIAVAEEKRTSSAVRVACRKALDELDERLPGEGQA